MADALFGSIVLNEVMPDPNSATGATGPRFDTDGSGSTTPVDEFIEIYNSGPTAVNIGGLQLWDQTLGNWFTFPPGTVLQPGGHAMVMVGAAGGPGPALGPDDLAFYAGRGSAVLNNGSDNAILLDPASGQYVQLAYGGAPIVTPGSTGAFAGFPSGSTRIGAGEDFGIPTPGLSLQRSPSGSDTILSTNPNPANDNICFVAGSRIATPCGARPIEDLRPGDLVLTTDGALPVLWIGQTRFDPRRVMANPRLWPVTIRAHALGPDLPARDLSLSRQHRLRLSGPVAARMVGAPAVLIPAAALLGHPGIRSTPPAGVLHYYHLLLPRHAVLLAENLPAESLHLGPMARAALPPAALAELDLILPHAPWAEAPAHPMLRMRQGRTLLARHRRNALPLRP